jgi:hypothetical protein
MAHPVPRPRRFEAIRKFRKPDWPQKAQKRAKKKNEVIPAQESLIQGS